MTEVTEVVEVQGSRVPRIGFGTWELEGDGCYEAVRHALELGYRHLDTAQMYGNEAQVGKALADSGVDRGEVWITTKVKPGNAAADRVRSSLDESLGRLGTDHVDLLLLHWPTDDVPLEETMGAFAQVREQGKARHVGVSNFTPSLLEEALRHTQLLTDQVEYHPYLSQDRLLELVRDRGLLLTAYSPSAKGDVARDDTLTSIGEEHGKTAVQVALRWLIQQPAVVAIPRSSSAEHRGENLDVFDFELSEDEMARIHHLARTTDERIIDPPFAPAWER